MSDAITQNETELDLKLPKLWNVTILNDDFTPIDFVIHILCNVFNKTEQHALEMTLRVHEEGSAIVGTYTKDIAETKCRRAAVQAEAHGHPLRLFAEPE